MKAPFFNALFRRYSTKDHDYLPNPLWQSTAAFTAAAMLLYTFYPMYVEAQNAVSSSDVSNRVSPVWWADRGVIDDEAEAQHFALVNAGQLKWMATTLHEEFESTLPLGAGFTVFDNPATPEKEGFAEPLAPYESGYEEWAKTNPVAVNLGQAKNTVLPFYNKLNEISPEWVKSQLVKSGLDAETIEANNKSAEGYYYPWTVISSDDENFSAINQGQIKLMFALRMREDSETTPDGLPDIFELALAGMSDAEYAEYIGDSTASNPFVGKALEEISWDPSNVYIHTTDEFGERISSLAKAPIAGLNDANQSALSLLDQHETVGSLGGALSIGGNGASNYMIPIKLPRGAGGLTPELAITYSSSSANNGLLGLGFDFAGFQKIVRGKSDHEKNGYIPADYEPLFSHQDRYYLDGELLVGMEDSGGNALLRGSEADAETYVKGVGVLYKTEKESFAEIKGSGALGDWGPHHFEVRTKDGKILEFGNCNSSCTTDPNAGSALVWHLNKLTDASGNHYIYEYERDVIDSNIDKFAATDYRPSRIKFTANDAAGTSYHHEVVFNYEDRSDRRFAYMGGIKTLSTKRLQSIDINYIGNGASQLLWKYNFAYDLSKQTGRSLLTSVTQVAADGESTEPTVFKWNEADVDWSASSSMWEDASDTWNIPQLFEDRKTGRSPENIRSDDNGWRFVDVNSDGYLDLIRSKATHGYQNSVTGTKSVSYNHGAGYATTDPRDASSNWSIPSNIWFAVDIDDDLKNGLLSTSSPMARMGDFNGDGHLDFIGKETNNSEDTDWSWSGTKYETWLRMRFPTYLRNLDNNSFDLKTMPLRIYDKNKSKKGYRLAKGLTYDEVVDLDGDGDLDFVLKTAETDLQNGSGHTVSGNYTSRMIENRINEGLGWVEGPVNKGMPVNPYNTHLDRDYGVRLIDINGDGLTDVIKSDGKENGNGALDPDSSRAHINVNGALGWYANSSRGWEPQRPLTDSFGNDVGTRLIDLNGDGLADLFSSDRTLEILGAVPANERLERIDNSYQMFSPYGIPYLPYFYYNPVKKQVILPFEIVGSISGLPSHFVTGIDENGNGSYDYYVTLDYWFHNNNTVNQTYQGSLFFNRGNVKYDNTGNQIVHSAWADEHDNELFDFDLGFSLTSYQYSTVNAKDIGSEFIDLNGDQLTDLIVSTDEAGAINKSFTNTGFGFVDGYLWRIPDAKRITYQNSDIVEGRRHIMFKDLDADGFTDMITDTYTASPKVYINKAVQEVVTAVTDGFDKTLVIDYKRLNDYSVDEGAEKSTYTKGNQATVPKDHLCIVDASLVVSRLGEPKVRNAGDYEATPEDYFWKRYHYGDLRYDKKWNTALGFGWMETIDEYRQQYSRAEFCQNYPLQGSTCSIVAKILGEDGTYANGVIVSEEEVEIVHTDNSSLFDQNGNGTASWKAVASGAGGYVYSLYQKSSDKKFYDIDGSHLHTTSMEQMMYDYGNVKTNVSTTTEAATGDQYRVSTSHDYDPVNTIDWQLANLQQTKVTTSVTPGSGAHFSGATSVTKTSAFEYYANGSLKKEIIEPALGTQRVEKSYTYSDYGNPSSQAVTAYNPVTSSFETRTSYSYYEGGFGRFRTSEKDVLGHETKDAYDQASSTLLSSEDINQQKISFRYDSFGTQLVSYGSDGTVSVKITQRAADAADPEIAFIRKSQSSGSPPAAVYVDYLGREVYQESIDFHGRTIRTKTEYDSTGRKYRESYPYLASSTPTDWVEVTSFDVLHRPLITTYPDGTFTKVEYDGYSSTQYNRKGQKKVTYQDVNERTYKVVDNAEHTILYKFDVSGNTRETEVQYQDGTNHIVTADYDPLFGYQTGITDPSFGTSQSFYNGFGDVYKTQDALGNKTEFEFDQTGRTVKRTISSSTAVESVTDYSFDTATGAALGALHTVEMYDRSGTLTYQSTNTYDRLGRSTRQDIKVSKPEDKYSYENFYTTSAYDAFSRVIRATNTGGLSIASSYNEYGFNDKTFNSHTGEVYWQPIQYDIRGNLTEEHLANGAIRNDKEYNNADSLLIRSKSSAVNSGVIYQDFGFDWDSIGNLQHRTDHIHSLREDFSYDNLNRLKNVYQSDNVSAASSSVAQSFDYDDNGNLRTKHGAGDLRYEGSRAQAVSHYDKENGDTHNIVYDTNGRFIAERNGIANVRTASWTAFGKPSEFTADLGPRIYNGNGTTRYEEGYTTAKFHYDAGLDRIHQVMERIEKGTFKQNQVTTTYLGSYERKIHRARDSLADDYTIEKTEHKYTVAGVSIVTYTETSQDITAPLLVGNQVSPSSEVQRYQLTDHLGSVSAILENLGTAWKVIERHSFDAWGTRRNAETWSDAEYTSSKTSDVTSRGYTGHEMLDEIGLVHMNGRIYHSEIGRFLSPDPFVQSPDQSQNFNRYAYVLNNPLSYTDPSGYFINAIIAIVVAIVQVAVSVVIAAVVVAVKVAIFAVKALFTIGKFLFGTSGGYGAAFSRGFAWGFGNALANGAGIGNSIGAGLKGGIQAVATAGFADAVGASKFLAKSFTLTKAVQLVGHGIIQGVSNEMMGASFSDGFINGVLSKSVSLSVGFVGVEVSSDTWGGVAVNSMINGAITATISVHVTNSNWGHSFFMATMSYLFNEARSRFLSHVGGISPETLEAQKTLDQINRVRDAIGFADARIGDTEDIKLVMQKGKGAIRPILKGRIKGAALKKFGISGNIGDALFNYYFNVGSALASGFAKATAQNSRAIDRAGRNGIRPVFGVIQISHFEVKGLFFKSLELHTETSLFTKRNGDLFGSVNEAKNYAINNNLSAKALRQ